MKSIAWAGQHLVKTTFRFGQAGTLVENPDAPEPDDPRIDVALATDAERVVRESRRRRHGPQKSTFAGDITSKSWNA